MAHKPLYTFSVLNNRILQFKYNTSTQIARLHSFSNTKSKNRNIFTNAITLYDNLLACSNYDGTIVVINIFTRKKSIIKSTSHHINTLHFLDKNILLSTDINNLIQVYDLKDNSVKDITTPSILSILKDQKKINLETLSSSILAPFIANNSLAEAFGLINNNPMLSGTTEHKKLEEMYRVVFEHAVEALREEKNDKAHKLLEAFKTVSSKKEEINALFIDFKHFERFKLHIIEKKYSIAYALCSKHTLLKLTPEFQEMETIYLKAYELAQKHMLIGQKDLAKESLEKYMTVLSKRDDIKNLLSGYYSYKDSEKEQNSSNIYIEKLLLAYEKNNFKECYELIDKYAIEDFELTLLLEKHWIKLMIECEDYALDGDIKSIKTTLNELIGTQTRADKIGDLLRVAFYSKINILQNKKNFNSAENIIYAYIDIFGVDVELREVMKKFEKTSTKKLAITQHQGEKTLRDYWLKAELIMEL